MKIAAALLTASLAILALGAMSQLDRQTYSQAGGGVVVYSWRFRIDGNTQYVAGPDANLNCYGAPLTIPTNLARLSIAPETTTTGAQADMIRFNFAGAATHGTSQAQLGGDSWDITAETAATMQVCTESNLALWCTGYYVGPRP
jgi:hypothetical protein